ncbi:DNA polymerase [Sporosarcina sp. FA9]|uniref:DNA polymerase n=1 Tax=Sporosarcina sp. FA9 TaxID=3413030 RepID=UPI003F658DCF
MGDLSLVRNFYEINVQDSTIHLSANGKIPKGHVELNQALLKLKRHKTNTYHVLTKPEIGYERIIGVDIETTALLPLHGEIKLVSVYGNNTRFVTKDLNEVRDILSDPTVLKIFHNATFDVSWFRAKGYVVNSFVCTFLMSQILNNHVKKGNSLQELAKTKLGMELNKTYQHADNWKGNITEEHKEYALMDAKVAYELYSIFKEAIKQKHLDIVLAREINAMDAIIELNIKGIRFDYDGWEVELQAMQRERDQLLEMIRLELKVPTLNMQSPKQITAALAANGIDVESTKDEVLAKYENQLSSIKDMRQYKKLQKQLSSYGEKIKNAIDKDGRLRGNWKLCGADTFRMTCKEPNLQGMPSISKPYFQSKEGHSFIVADYSTIELRILAEVSQDQELVKAFHEGEDLHNKTAAFIFGNKPIELITPTERKVGKIINFGLVYGMTKWGLQKKINAAIDDPIELYEAEAFRTKYFELYKGVSDYQDQMLKADFIQTLGGRYWKEGHHMLEKGKIARFNYPIQASCAEGLKESLSLFLQGRNASWGLVAVVHDEIVIEVPDSEVEMAKKFLEKSMIGGMSIIVRQVPITVEVKVAKHWVK